MKGWSQPSLITLWAILSKLSLSQNTAGPFKVSYAMIVLIQPHASNRGRGGTGYPPFQGSVDVTWRRRTVAMIQKLWLNPINQCWVDLNHVACLVTSVIFYPPIMPPQTEPWLMSTEHAILLLKSLGWGNKLDQKLDSRRKKEGGEYHVHRRGPGWMSNCLDIFGCFGETGPGSSFPSSLSIKLYEASAWKWAAETHEVSKKVPMIKDQSMVSFFLSFLLLFKKF